MREELVEWVGEIIMRLATNPFVQYSHTDALRQLMDEQIHQLELNDSEKHRKKLLKKGFSEEEIDHMENINRQANEAIQARLKGEEAEIPEEIKDLFEEFFADFENDAINTPFDAVDDNTDDDPFSAYQERFQEYVNQEDAKQKQKDSELSKLLKATPISQLFRKISRAIHPDLESDEALKQQKHEQMAKLIQAREQKDIPTILNMHLQHVGALPEGLFEGNFEKLTKS